MRFLILLLALGGIFDSALALRIHYQDPSQAPPCAVTEKFDCGIVNHSRYAVFPPISFDEPMPTTKTHIPVAIFGIIGYALIAIVALIPGAFKLRSLVLLQFAEVGFAFAAFLSFMEEYILQKWCIYCLWSQGIIAGILLLSIVMVVMDYRRKSSAMAVTP
jgi:vitamin-K-epoxide reductase (warfarin-sensitive)